jgi:hypothetical protein
MGISGAGKLAVSLLTEPLREGARKEGWHWDHRQMLSIFYSAPLLQQQTGQQQLILSFIRIPGDWQFDRRASFG